MPASALRATEGDSDHGLVVAGWQQSSNHYGRADPASVILLIVGDFPARFFTPRKFPRNE